jgi:hypothetical protein
MMAAFTDLREQVDAGLLAYPYSTRELVNVARHLQRFPRDTYAMLACDRREGRRHFNVRVHWMRIH